MEIAVRGVPYLCADPDEPVHRELYGHPYRPASIDVGPLEASRGAIGILVDRRRPRAGRGMNGDRGRTVTEPFERRRAGVSTGRIRDKAKYPGGIEG